MSERESGADERVRRDQDAATEGRAGESADARRGIPGKGFDAGTGYGGAGADSAYEGESSYGGQAGYGGSTTRGAYDGGTYGRPNDPEVPFAGRDDAAEDASPPTAEEGAESEDELNADG